MHAKIRHAYMDNIARVGYLFDRIDAGESFHEPTVFLCDQGGVEAFLCNIRVEDILHVSDQMFMTPPPLHMH